MLLNAALREDLWSQGVRYYGDQDVYAFMGRPDEPPRRLKYANVKMRSTVTVVSHYEHKSSKSGKPHKYLRHAAFQGRFRFLACLVSVLFWSGREFSDGADAPPIPPSGDKEIEG